MNTIVTAKKRVLNQLSDFLVAENVFKLPHDLLYIYFSFSNFLIFMILAPNIP